MLAVNDLGEELRRCNARSVIGARSGELNRPAAEFCRSGQSSSSSLPMYRVRRRPCSCQ